VDPPEADELEVSVFGPGVGECIAVHVGNGRWVIIDSCRDSRTGDVSALAYLRSLGLNPAECVDWVVATHAHNDHVKGLGEIVRVCGSASVVLPDASSLAEFFAITRIDQRLDYYDTNARVYSEFEQVISELELSGRAGSSLFYAIAGRRLPLGTAMGAGAGGLEMIFLAPSDHAVTMAKRAFGRLLLQSTRPDAGERRTQRDPNTFSSALLLRCLDFALLLGGDVKNGSASWGWKHIAINFAVDREIDVFKVAHHGDPKAHHPPIWAEWLSDGATAIVTPYRPSGRPRDADVARIVTLGVPLWTTARSGAIAASSTVRRTDAKLRGTATGVAEAGGITGQVRYRRKGGGSPEVDVFGPAARLN
jgi:beta-lactamase superfamily II metal-dependent hydrolase